MQADSPAPFSTQTTEGVLSRSIRSGSWLVFGTVIQRAIGFTSFFVLARLLSPADFGVLSVVLLIPNTLQALTETGLAAAAIQRGGDIHKFLDPIWTIGIVRSCTIALIVWVAAPWIGSFLHAESAISAIRLGGLFVIITNLSNIGELFFSKDLDFKKFFFRNIARDITYVVVACSFALVYRSYWVLIIATAASYTAMAISTYVLNSYRPTLSFAWHHLKVLYGYSRWTIAQGWLDQLYGFSEQAMVAHTNTLSSTGFYSKAKNMASVAPGFLTPILNIVGFSALAQVRQRPEKIKEGFIRSLDILHFFLVPVTLLLFVGGGKVVMILLGNVWLPITNPLRAFLIFYFLESVNNIVTTVLNAIGYPDKQVKLTTVKIPIILFAMWYLIPHLGLLAPPIALIAGTLPTLMLNFYHLTKLTTIRYRTIAMTLFGPIFCSLLVGLPALFYKDTLLALPNIALLGILCGLGITYVVTTIGLGSWFKVGPYQTLFLIKKHILP